MNTAAFFYHVFNLTIASELEIPNWQSLASVSEVDVYIQYVDELPVVKDAIVDKGYFQINNTEYRIEMSGIAKFAVLSGTKILIQREGVGQEKLLLHYLQSRIFSVLLFQRTIIPLAASTVLLNNKCIVFTGNSVYPTKLLPAWYQREHQALLTAYLTPILENCKTATGFSYLDSTRVTTAVSTPTIHTVIAFESITTAANTLEVIPLQGMEKFTLLKDNLYYKEVLLHLEASTLFHQLVPLLKQVNFYKICIPREAFSFDQLIEKINNIIYDY